MSDLPEHVAVVIKRLGELVPHALDKGAYVSIRQHTSAYVSRRQHSCWRACARHAGERCSMSVAM
jgi:hypothetical protein